MLGVLAVMLMQAAVPPVAVPRSLKEAEAGVFECPADMTNFLYYPDRARRTNVTGVATVSCEIGASGKFERCFVVKEEPEGEGFGLAAIKLAQCVMKPKPGGTLSGRGEFPIRFALTK